jgi:hypothetical protein
MDTDWKVQKPRTLTPVPAILFLEVFFRKNASIDLCCSHRFGL